MAKWLTLLLLLFPSIAAADLLKTVNDRVNREVTYVSDEALWGRDSDACKSGPAHVCDVWDIAGRFGDCESIALKKLAELREHGIDGLIGLYYDKERKDYHAVLIVDGIILDGRRRFWEDRKSIRPASSEKFIYKARISGGAAWMVELGGKPTEPKWIRKIVPAKPI